MTVLPWVAQRRRGWPTGRMATCAVAVHLLVLCAVASAAAVADYIGKPVREVRLVSEGRSVQDQALLDLVETKVGQPLSMRQVRESLLHLFTLGRFQDIQIDASTRQDGVALSYDLIPLQVVERIEFRGNLGLPRNQLRDAVVERYGPTFRFDLVDEATRALEELFQDQGYLNARLGAGIKGPTQPNTLVFEIEAGPRVRIASIDVRGTPMRSAEQVLARLNLRPGGIYDRAAIDRRLAEYEAELRGRRYYEAVLDHTIVVRDDGQSVDLTLDIRPGSRVTVAFDGDPLPAAERRELVPIIREGSVDLDLLEDSDRRIEEYLRRQGYWKAQVAHTRNEIGSELSIVFTVQAGLQYRIADLEIVGNAAVPLAELESLVRLETGAPFVETEFDADVAAIAEYYRRLGHAQVQVRPTVNDVPAPAPGASNQLGPARVVPRIEIDEGVRTTIASVTIEGNLTVADEALRAVIASEPGAPFFRPQIAADRADLLLFFLNEGYETASVAFDVQASADFRTVDLVFTIREGPQVLVDHILIVGNTQIAASTIRRELELQPGQPLGLDDVAESRRRLTALGLFRRIEIREFSHGGGNRRDVVIAVDEAPPTTLAYGAGVELGQRLRRELDLGPQAVERLEFAPRGFFEIGRRNLWGKNRSVNLFTRVSVRPSPEPTGSNLGFNEYRVLGTYREPRAFGRNADVIITGFLERAIRSSFTLFRRGVNAELRRVIRPTVSASASYTYEENRLPVKRFSQDDELLIDRLFPEVVLSTFSTALVRDTRDDPFEPTRGTLLGFDAEIAGRRIGSEVGFAKTFVQGFFYRRLLGSRRIVVAAGARLGLAAGFPREEEATEVRELPASERFFAGGDTTVRGFALDRLGTIAASPGETPTIDRDGFPTGGNALIVLNSELRVPLTRDLGAVAFLDAGNVFDRVGNLDLGRIRGGAGFGIRYGSPIGPIRVDLGFKLNRRQFANGDTERLPALHVSIGQAF